MADIGEAGGLSVRTRPLSEPLPTTQTGVDTGRSSTCPVRSFASSLAAGRLVDPLVESQRAIRLVRTDPRWFQ